MDRNHFGIRRKDEAKKLPREVQVYMMSRFELLPEYIDTLRCFIYDGLMNEKRVKHIRVFSPYRAEQNRVSIKTKNDLEQLPEMLLFEGHIDNQGGIHMADRRAPIKLKKASASTI